MIDLSQMTRWCINNLYDEKLKAHEAQYDITTSRAQHASRETDRTNEATVFVLNEGKYRDI